jgi:hypothetical protein
VAGFSERSALCLDNSEGDRDWVSDSWLVIWGDDKQRESAQMVCVDGVRLRACVKGSGLKSLER